MVISFFAFVIGVVIILKKIIFGDPVQGFATLITTILFLGGVQLISLGVIGEYLSRIYIETKNRPIFIVEELVNFDDK